MRFNVPIALSAFRDKKRAVKKLCKWCYNSKTKRRTAMNLSRIFKVPPTLRFCPHRAAVALGIAISGRRRGTPKGVCHAVATSSLSQDLEFAPKKPCFPARTVFNVENSHKSHSAICQRGRVGEAGCNFSLPIY